MQVAPTNNGLSTPGQTTALASVRVVAGDLAALPSGKLIQAAVASVSQGQAVISVAGQTLTVRLSGTSSLPLGPILLLRPQNAGPAANVTLQLVSNNASASTTTQARVATANLDPPSQNPTSNPAAVSGGSSNSPAIISPPAASATAQAATQVGPLSGSQQLVRVDVLAVLPDGRVRIAIDGQEEVATTTEQLAAGGRYVLQIERTSLGLALSSAPDTPDLPADLSAAILRSALPPDLGAALKPLLEELANLDSKQNASPQGFPALLQKASAAVRDALGSFLPTEERPLNASELKNLVEDGGLHFEAKLARLASEGEGNAADGGAKGDPGGGSTARASATTGNDLKESLLRLLQAAQELRGSLQLPAARTTLEGIESQQAANVFAETQGTPYILQIPFPDGGEWRTLHLAIEPDGSGKGDRATSDGFRMLMHVPLTDLGETWIDAGLSGNNLRAVLYLNEASARDRVRAELPALRVELQSGGFSEVLLDVRPVEDLPSQQRKRAAAMQIGRPGSGSVLDVKA